jgi:hypothetical protein
MRETSVQNKKFVGASVTISSPVMPAQIAPKNRLTTRNTSGVLPWALTNRQANDDNKKNRRRNTVKPTIPPPQRISTNAL